MKKRLKMGLSLGLIAFLLALSLLANRPGEKVNWGLLTAAVMILALYVFFLAYDYKRPDAREVTLTATLAALAIAGRVAFTFVPSLQPATFVIMMAGRVLGVSTGFMVGALTALGSNIFLGQGPWTPWQMFAWGMAGAAAGLFARYPRFHRLRFALFTCLWGFVFGWIMNVWHWVGFITPLNAATFAATYVFSLPFDALHAGGNFLFTILAGEPFYRILYRYRQRLDVGDDPDESL